jgi:alpha/beta superfamily hydrolase
MADRRELRLDGPSGSLEALVEGPPAAPRAVGVICHPHPLHEGTMHNKVVHTLARALLRLDCVTLRFNFRGVGQSEGAFADGLGELEDALAVCRWARDQFPDLPLALAGFSFGAAVALAAATRERPFALVTVAPPVGRLIDREIRPPAVPWLIVQGDADELVACEQVLRWVNTLEPGPEVAVLSGVDHFFHGRLLELRDIVTTFLRAQAPLGVEP